MPILVPGYSYPRKEVEVNFLRYEHAITSTLISSIEPSESKAPHPDLIHLFPHRQPYSIHFQLENRYSRVTNPSFKVCFLIYLTPASIHQSHSYPGCRFESEWPRLDAFPVVMTLVSIQQVYSYFQQRFSTPNALA